MAGRAGGLFGRFARLRFAKGDPAIERQRLKYDVESAAVLVGEGDAYLRPKAVFLAVFFVFADAVSVECRFRHDASKGFVKAKAYNTSIEIVFTAASFCQMSDFDNEKSASGALLGHTICTLIG